MKNQFIFFTTVIGNESLLKEEIRLFFPKLTLSYSQKGFITYKNMGDRYSLEELSKMNFAFALRVGLNGVKSSKDRIEKDIEAFIDELGVPLDKISYHRYSTFFQTDAPISEGISKVGDTVINIIETKENEYWIGAHQHTRETNSFPNSNPGIQLPNSAPSRAYLKIAEACKIFGVVASKNQTWIEYGSAPGGASYYLLSMGCKLFGNDPAEMDDICKNHPNFTHLQKPVQDLSQEELPAKADWVTVDLNLNPKQSLKEVLRLSKKYKRSLKGIFFTIKMVKPTHINNIQNYKSQLTDFGFKYVKLQQLPSHKKEFLIFASK